MNAHPMSNRHPVDQLGDVREQIKALQERETELKEQVSAMMGAADSLGGGEWIARQTRTTRKGAIDAKALEKAGLDPDRFRKPDSDVKTIRCERRVTEDA